MNQAEWKEMADEVKQYIMNLEQASRSVGDLLYDGLQADTIVIFQQYLNGFFDISQAIIITVESSVEFAPALRESVMLHVQELMLLPEQFQLLLSQERWVALADILKYEIPEQLQKISSAMKGNA
ncbi:hypothetical protein ACX1C1_05130 [Paenibacillus sp. strain BS8-2]